LGGGTRRNQRGDEEDNGIPQHEASAWAALVFNPWLGTSAPLTSITARERTFDGSTASPMCDASESS
jgi:hypothetical protein